MKQKRRTAISYKRFSTPEQAQGHSLKRQTEAAENLCKKMEWKLESNLQDLGISAYCGDNAKKGALAGFLQAVEAGKVKKGTVLIVEAIDRISREAPIIAMGLIGQVLLAGVWIATTDPEKVYTAENAADTGVMLELVLHICLAYDESKKKSIRVGKAWRDKKDKAKEKPVTSKVPAWLTLEDGKIKCIPGRAAIVKKIFALTLGGLGTTAIAKQLNSTGVPVFGYTKRSVCWHKSYLLKILKNKAVFGEYQPHKGHIGRNRKTDGDPVKGYYPTIIPEYDFHRVQQVLNNRMIVKGKTGSGVANLFTGLMRDPSNASTFTLVNKNGRSIVNSAATRGEKGARYLGFRYPVYERAFLQCIYDLSLSDLLPDDQQDDNGVEIEGLEIKAANLSERVKQIKKRLESDSDFDSLVDVLKNVEVEKQSTLERIEKLKCEERPTKDILAEQKTLIERMTDGDVENRQKLKLHLRNCIKEIGSSIEDMELAWQGKVSVYRIIKSQIVFISGKVRTIWVAYQRGKKNSDYWFYFSSSPIIRSGFNKQEVEGLWHLFANTGSNQSSIIKSL